MCTLFLHISICWGPHMVYHGLPIYISYSYDQMWLVGKLSSHHPSHMHNTRHRTKFNSNFDTQLFNYSKTQKMLFVPSSSHMEQPAKFA